MHKAKKEKIKHTFEIIHPFLVGLLLTLKGLEKIDHHYTKLGSIILLFAAILFCYSVYELIKKQHSKALTIMVHIFECIALLFTAWIYQDEGRHLLQYAMLLAATGFLVSVFVMLFKKPKGLKNH